MFVSIVGLVCTVGKTWSTATGSISSASRPQHRRKPETSCAVKYVQKLRHTLHCMYCVGLVYSYV